MATSTLGNPVEYLTNLSVTIGDIPDNLIDEVTVNEVSLTESLLTPGLQTTVFVQSTLHTDPPKNLNNYYGKYINIKIERPILKRYSELPRFDFNTTQKIYRLGERSNENYQIENFKIDACDPSLLKDAATWVSASWACTPPHAVVSDVLTRCIGVSSFVIEQSAEPRPYIAENLHPFQVITQQGEVALTTDGKYDPSFVHFMTYQDLSHNDYPTHNFRSLNKMALEPPVMTFIYNGKGLPNANYLNPYDIMSYSFPCDFDLLSDILNGYDENGNFIKGLTVENPTNQTGSLVGTQGDCGLTPYIAKTNLGSDDGCPTNVEQYLLYRKARMALLDQDKVALRITIPFNPNLNAGRVISVILKNHKTGGNLYGTGRYLITNMTHNIKRGGLGVTILDCVSKTVAAGKV